jgi:hypothetical protein
MSSIKRNLEEQGQLYLNKFWSGLYDNRNPLFTPVSAMGIQLIARQDTLFGGENMEITPKMTLQRRKGFLRYSTASLNTGEYVQQFYSFKNLAGTIVPICETNQRVCSFTTTTITTIKVKTTTNQGSFATVQNLLYYVDGVDADRFKWDGTTLTNFGIATPTVLPTVNTEAGSLSPTVGYQWGYCYYNAATGHVSTMSGVCSVGVGTSLGYIIGVTASPDPQVTNIQIYRTLDGGSLFYLLATVPNVTNLTAYIDDNSDDSGVLNELIIAPISDSNNPPPSGMSLLTWYSGRLWGAVGNVVYYAAGTDTTNGSGQEAWPPLNFSECPGGVTAFAPSSAGLMVGTVDDLYLVLGTSSATFTTPQLWQSNMGLASQNNVAMDGANVYLLTSRGQMFIFQLSSSPSLTDIGFDIGTHIAALNPVNAYVAIHRSGYDEGCFVSDGVGNYWRYSVNMGVWCPVATLAAGVKCLESIEVTPGVWRLMMARPLGSSDPYLCCRDVNTWSDDGATYACNAIIGSINVAPPRHTATVEAIVVQHVAVGSVCTTSVLMNEISGTFVKLNNPVDDPVEYSGTPLASQSIWQKRYALKSAASPVRMHAQHMQIQVAFPAEAQPNEVLGIGISPPESEVPKR